MAYKINGVEIAYPTTMKWDERKEHGVNGLGNSVYGRYRTAELQWDLAYPEDVQTLQEAYLYSQNTGAVVIEVPRFGISPYQFTEYSGCYLQDLQVGEFFEEHYTGVTLIVTKVQA
jgi:hypothetical protein